MGSRSSSSSSSRQPVEAPNSLLSNSRIKILDLIGEGEIEGFWPQSGAFGSDPKASSYFDEVPLINGDGSANFNVSGDGFNFGYTVGASGQQAIPDFDRVESVIPLSPNTRIANPPAGAGAYKTVLASFTSAVYPDADSIKVSVRVPSLLTQNTNGDTNGYTITYAIDISVNGGAFEEIGNYTIVGKCTGPYFKTTVHTLPKPNPPQNLYSWKIRVRRVSENILSIRTQNEIFVDSISVVSSNSFSYPASALVAIELSAEQFSSIPTRAYEIKGLKVKIPDGYTPTQYNVDKTITEAVYPNIWMGNFSTTKTWTDNPAWVFYDLCTNNRYGLGNYIREEWLDKWTLYEIAQQCDALVDDGKGGLEPQFTCNISIQSQQDAYELLMNLVSVFRGMLYWANGRLFPISNGIKSPVDNFTNSNVIGGKFIYSDTARNVRSTVVSVRWIDPDNLYRETVEYFEDSEGIARYGYIQKDFSAFATISKGQAIRAANWLLTTERLSTETITFQTSYQGFYIKPGDLFNVYDNFRTNKIQGGRIKYFSTGRDILEIDRSVNLLDGFSYSLSAIVPSGNFDSTGQITGSDQISRIRQSQIQTRQIITSPGTGYTTLTLNSGFGNTLYKGSVWVISTSGFGTNTTEVFDSSFQYRCLATSEPEAGVVEVLGVEYFTGVNFAITTGYNSISNPPVEGNSTIPAAPSNLLTSGVTGLLNNNSYFSYIQLNWTKSTDSIAYYKISGSLTGGAASLISTSINTGYNYSALASGEYTFYVGAVSLGGVESNFISNNYTISDDNPLGDPPPLSGLYLISNIDTALSPTGYYRRGLNYAWTFPTGANGLEIPQVQFLSGFKTHILNPDDDTDLVTPVTISDPDTRFTTVTPTIINSFAGGPRRDFKLYVETADQYDNLISGGSLIVNNPPPKTPIYNSFYAARGGLNYIISPDPNDTDISGIYLWTGGTPTPRFDNAYYTGHSTAGFVSHDITGNYEIYYAITDSWGTGGCAIYGPILVGTNLNVTGLRANQSPYIADGVTFSGKDLISLTQNGQNIIISGRAVTGIKVNNGSSIFDLINFTGTGPISIKQVGQDIIISGLENPPIYVQNYTNSIRTVNNYSPDSQGSIYAGLDSGVAGSPYANVTDVNSLRVAYENLRNSYDNIIQVVTAMIDDDQSAGLKR